ncbi:hypothetical protein GCM10023238_32600 [Streptomyces heliomycini]
MQRADGEPLARRTAPVHTGGRRAFGVVSGGPGTTHGAGRNLMTRVKQYAVAATGQWTDREEGRRRLPAGEVHAWEPGLNPDRVRAVPEPLGTDPLLARGLAGHLSRIRRRGGPRPARVPPLRLRGRTPRQRRRPRWHRTNPRP